MPAFAQHQQLQLCAARCSHAGAAVDVLQDHLCLPLGPFEAALPAVLCPTLQLQAQLAHDLLQALHAELLVLEGQRVVHPADRRTAASTLRAHAWEEQLRPGLTCQTLQRRSE